MQKGGSSPEVIIRKHLGMWTGSFPHNLGNGVPQALRYRTRVWLNFYLVCYLKKLEEVRLAWPLPFIGVLGHQVAADTLLQCLLNAKLIFCFSSIVWRRFLYFPLSLQLRAACLAIQLVFSDSRTVFSLYIMLKNGLAYSGSSNV